MRMSMNSPEYLNMLSHLVLGIGIVLSLTIEISTKKSKEILPWFSMIIFLIAGLISLTNINKDLTVYTMLHVGGKAAIFNFIFNFIAFIVVLSSHEYIKKYGAHFGEFYILLQSSVLGMMLMAGAEDIFVVFLGLELMSICFYILAGINRKKQTANESAMKYFLLGAFATGFLVYGIGLIYGSAGTTDLNYIIANSGDLSGKLLFNFGLALFLIGFSFKIAAVPFHMWVPDVYQGAATTVTGLMSTAGKAAAFSVLIIVLTSVWSDGTPNTFSDYFAAIALLSTLYGSIVAIAQKNLKRMLAYSSITHAGYMAIGLAAGNIESIAGIIFYLAAYAFMNLGAFAVIAAVEGKNDDHTDLDAYAGLNYKSPLLAAFMALFMFALAGIPPLAGFFGKYYVFVGAIDQGLVWLAVIGVLSSAISVYFYLRIVVYMYFKNSVSEFEIKKDPYAYFAVVLTGFLVLGFGILPDTLMNLITSVLQ